MTATYTPPKGGTRIAPPKPQPRPDRIPMVTWRQPVGGVRTATPPAR